MQLLKVAIVTWGSRGDFQPYLALATAFQRAGHEVRLGIQPLAGFTELAATHGLELISLAPAAGEEYLRTADAAIKLSDPVRAVRLILDDLLLPAFEQMHARCVELAGWADVMICHFLQIAGRTAAETTGTPCITGTLVPTQIPTGSRPPEGLPSLGRRINRAAWGLAGGYMNKAWLSPINRARESVSLGPLDDVASRGFYSSEMNLVAVSPTVFPRPRDWPPRHRMTGFWLLDPPANWTPPAEVAEFLSTGPAPIAVGFGSMTTADNDHLTTTVLEAIELAGVRAVLDPGMAELGDRSLPDGVILGRDVGHAWLLPRVAAIVHHGGMGTSAAAFHSGVPSVVVPHVFDQFTWARLAAELGVAPPPVPFSRLTAPSLAAAISAAVGDQSYRSSGRALREKLELEDGAGTAVGLVEDFLAHGPAPAGSRSA